MNSAYLSLDYELFFGSKTGTIDACLIEPTEQISRLLEQYEGKLVLFVDVGFIVALREQAKKHRALRQGLSRIQEQLHDLVERGHDVQLHIHPHWIDSYFDGDQWRIDTRRYRLHDFSRQEAAEIIHRYHHELSDMVGDRVFAYRAGGWCIQPFSHIQSALKASEIWLDSTVYVDGLSEDQQRGFDFRTAPRNVPWWRFEDDPLVEQKDGYFVEFPISSYTATPWLFWRMALIQKLLKNTLKPFGDGSSMRADKIYYINKLIKSSVSVLSIDGIKSDFTLKAIRSGQVSGEHINIMGHPKSLSRYSISKFAELLEASKGQLRFESFQQLTGLRAG